MKLPRIIGLTGFAGVGKDTVADLLVQQYGYVKLSLADPIKEMLNQRFSSWTMEDWADRDWKEASVIRHNARIQGGELVVEQLSPRQMAQWLGTEVGRTIGGPDVWLNVMWRRYELHHSPAPLVVPDVRFDNEADFIREKGGVVVRITRMGAKPVAAHVSERGLTKPADLTVENFAPSAAEFANHALQALQLLKVAA